MKEELVKLIPQVWILLSPLFAIGVGWLGVQMHRLLNANVTSTNYKTAAAKMTDLATTTVLALNQKVVDDLRDPTKPGVLDEATAARLKAQAVEDVMAALGDAKKIARDLGVAEVERLRARVADNIEAAVQKSKRPVVTEAMLIEPGAIIQPMAEEPTR